jgi:hypothetical protein
MNQQITSLTMTTQINNRIGKLFPPPAIYGGYALILFGLFLIFGLHANNSWWIGLILIAFGPIWILPYTGILFPTETKQYKDYIDFAGIKIGSWKALDEFPFLTILQSSYGWETRRFALDTYRDTEKCFEIYLMDKSQRERMVIKRLTDEDEAKKEASLIAEQLEIPFTVYNPPHALHRRR